MRRASTLASSLLSRTLATSHGGAAVSYAVNHHRLLQVALYGSSSSTGSSYTRWWRGSPARALSLGVAGALVSVAAVQEVHAKEPPPSELVPKEVVLYQYEACPFCNKVKGENLFLNSISF
jgi:microsomal prostaglandin-E synthase 2